MARSLSEIIEHIMRRRALGRPVVLSPHTAGVVEEALRLAFIKPNRNSVARALCDMRCERLCYGCISKANEVDAMYRGERTLNPTHPPAGGPGIPDRRGGKA